MTQDNDPNLNKQIGGKAASMAPIRNGAAVIPDNEPEIDDRGTDQGSTAALNLR